jgi:hypothetical protein
VADEAPRVRLPAVEATGGPLTRPPGTLALLSALDVGDRLIGVEDDGSEVAYEVDAAAIDDRTTLGDVVDRDPRTGDLRIAVGVGAYDPQTGCFAATVTIRARPFAPGGERPDPR